MSKSEDPKADLDERQAFARLEKAVGRLLDERAGLLTRVREIEALLAQLKEGPVDPAEMQKTLTRLEDQNRVLKEKIQAGSEGVDRLLSRLRFLETQR
ncbi:MAG: hypothetical protein WD056_02280 [Gemmatimonadota bacterium]